MVPFPPNSLAAKRQLLENSNAKKSTLCTFASRLCQISLTNGCGCGIKRGGLKATASPKLTLSRFSALATNSVHQRPLNQNKSVSAWRSIKSLMYADRAASIEAASRGCFSLQVKQNQIWVEKNRPQISTFIFVVAQKCNIFILRYCLYENKNNASPQTPHFPVTWSWLQGSLFQSMFD